MKQAFYDVVAFFLCLVGYGFIQLNKPIRLVYNFFYDTALLCLETATKLPGHNVEDDKQ